MSFVDGRCVYTYIVFRPTGRPAAGSFLERTANRADRFMLVPDCRICIKLDLHLTQRTKHEVLAYYFETSDASVPTAKTQDGNDACSCVAYVALACYVGWKTNKPSFHPTHNNGSYGHSAKIDTAFILALRALRWMKITRYSKPG